ncbi:MAG: DsbA family protein, partial [Pyrinomonadaceae bacterium]
MRARLVVPVSKPDHIRGPATAPVTLVEYGDYECPYCGAAHLITSKILEATPDRLRFVFRHFPLSEVHPHAKLAAEAAEAAGAQGRFWPMHDLLFENQQTLDERHLVGFAEELGLDTKRFVRELNEGIYRERVREDFKSGVKSGVNATPTIFINGIRHDGSWE